MHPDDHRRLTKQLEGLKVQQDAKKLNLGPLVEFLLRQTGGRLKIRRSLLTGYTGNLKTTGDGEHLTYETIDLAEGTWNPEHPGASLLDLEDIDRYADITLKPFVSLKGTPKLQRDQLQMYLDMIWARAEERKEAEERRKADKEELDRLLQEEEERARKEEAIKARREQVRRRNVGRSRN